MPLRDTNRPCALIRPCLFAGSLLIDRRSLAASLVRDRSCAVATECPSGEVQSYVLSTQFTFEGSVDEFDLEDFKQRYVDLLAPPGTPLEGSLTKGDVGNATWGDRNLYGLLITYGRGAIAHATKKLSLVLDSSMEAESIASSKAG